MSFVRYFKLKVISFCSVLVKKLSGITQKQRPPKFLLFYGLGFILVILVQRLRFAEIDQGSPRQRFDFVIAGGIDTAALYFGPKNGVAVFAL